MSDPTRRQWDALLRNPDKGLAFREHLDPMVTTDECEMLLADLSDRVRGAEVDESEPNLARLVFMLEDADGGECKLYCHPPAEHVPDSLPPSLARVLQLHNGMSFPDDDGWAVHLNGLSDGALGTGFDPEAVGEVEGLDDPRSLVVPIDSFSDWFVLHPSETLEDGEPAVSLLSHEGGGLDEPLSREFGAPGHYLRLLGHIVLGDGDDRCAEFCT